MSTDQTAEDRYQAELKQSDIDHHTPTAGAMTGHIIANLFLHSLKIHQASLFATGTAALFLDQKAKQWIRAEEDFLNQLDRLLVSQGESIPTTTGQIAEYTMLEENGADKYRPGQEQLFDLVKDFDTQNLFITKAVKLAQKEEWPELEDLLAHLLAWTHEQIALAQRFLNHCLKEGLYSEEDEDDDDDDEDDND
jgi:hypothetical protein